MRQKNERKAVLLQVFFVLAIICQNHALAVNWNSIEVNDIEYYIQTDKSVYDLGENVEMLYRVTNLGTEDVKIFCSRSPEFNLWVQKDEETIWMKAQGWYWSSPGITLLVGESTELTHDWGMIDDDDNLVEQGIYDVVGVMYNEPWNDYNGRDYSITEVAVPITIVPEPVSLTLFVAGLYILHNFNKKRRS